MGLALLWIETLLVALLWVAALMSIAASRPAKSLLRGVCYLLTPLPLLGVGTLVLLSCMLKFGMGVSLNLFGPTLALAISYLVLVVLLVWRARRRVRDGVIAATFWPRRALVVLFLLAAASWTITLYLMDASARERVASLRYDAESIIEAAAPSRLRDDQNAALLYELASRIIQADPQKGSEHTGRSPEPNYTSPKVRAFLAKHAWTLDLIYRAGALRNCYFKHNYRDGRFTDVRDYQTLDTCADIVAMHAQSELADGHVDVAIEDVNTLFRIARHAGLNLPILDTNSSVRISDLAVNVLEDVLPKMTTSAQVRRLTADFPRLLSTLGQAMCMEEVINLSSFCLIAEGDRTAQEFRLPTGTVYRLFFLNDDLAIYRETMAKYRELAARPYHEVSDALLQLDHESSLSYVGRGEDAKLQRHPLPGMFAPALLQQFGAYFRRAAFVDARIQSARVAVAAMTFRFDHGRLPTSPGELMPAYIRQIPADPFDGKPLRCKFSADSAVIYSVGPDRKDEGGIKYRAYDPRKKWVNIPFQLNLRPSPQPQTRPAA